MTDSTPAPMFKLLSNIPTWDTLFEASSVGRTLQAFQLPNGWQDGSIGGLEVSTLTSFTDGAKPTARPQYLVLVVEPPYAIEAIRRALSDLAGEEMVDLVKAVNLDAVGPQCARLLQACRTVESRFLQAVPAPLASAPAKNVERPPARAHRTPAPAHSAPAKEPLHSKPTLLLAAFTLVAAGLFAQWVWLSRLIGSPVVSVSADLATLHTNSHSIQTNVAFLSTQMQAIAGTQSKILEELQRLKPPPSNTADIATQVPAQLKALADRVQALTDTQGHLVTVFSGFQSTFSRPAAPTRAGQTNTASPPSSGVPPR